jgi:hypothetical protein
MNSFTEVQMAQADKMDHSQWTENGYRKCPAFHGTFSFRLARVKFLPLLSLKSL